MRLWQVAGPGEVRLTSIDGGRALRRSTLNILVDTVALLLVAGMAFTGTIMRYILPPGSGGHGRGAARTLWGLGRHDWGDLHFVLAVVFGVVALVHVALHWAWVCETGRQLIGRGADGTVSSRRFRLGCGAGFLAVLIGAFALALWAASSQVAANQGDEAGGMPGGRRWRGRLAAPPPPGHSPGDADNAGRSPGPEQVPNRGE